MSIEISEKMIVVFCGIGVSLPFPNVEGEQGLVGMRLGEGENAEEVFGQIIAQQGVELFAQKVSATMIRAES